ncbi:MAG: phosphoribosyltransferase [Firmicutes bacterium]|nr:phosphoribosyltransferase [Bacillota bacterium]HXL04522.1 phosphoribosyltransferase [Bacillota bacterium]
MVFKNRTEAGKVLAGRLSQYRDKDALILALPRGGVPVAREVASALNAELDVVITRKIGAPGNPELAIGAVTDDGTVFLNDSLVAGLDVSRDFIDHKIKQAKSEIADYAKRYRGEQPIPKVADRVVVIVDDGIATGYTVLAAAEATLRKNPKKLVIAVPVAPRESVHELEQATGCQVIAVTQPAFFLAVGQFYEDFKQVSDEEVRNALRSYSEYRRTEAKDID